MTVQKRQWDSSLRSKRFRLVSEQKETVEAGDFRFWSREKLNENPPRSFTCAIFGAVFDSCSSFFAPKPQATAQKRLLRRLVRQ